MKVEKYAHSLQPLKHKVQLETEAIFSRFTNEPKYVFDFWKTEPLYNFEMIGKDHFKMDIRAVASPELMEALMKLEIKKKMKLTITIEESDED